MKPLFLGLILLVPLAAAGQVETEEVEKLLRFEAVQVTAEAKSPVEIVRLHRVFPVETMAHQPLYGPAVLDTLHVQSLVPVRLFDAPRIEK